MPERGKQALARIGGSLGSAALKIFRDALLPASVEKALRPERPAPGTFPYSYDKPKTTITIRPRAEEAVSFQALRAMAKNCELVRIAIQLRKEQLRGLEWDIIPRPGTGIPASELEEERARIRDLFRYPDQLNDYNFSDFLAAWIEDLLVLDAAAIYLSTDRAGHLRGMSVVDGATIEPILTDRGFVPEPPLPAYAQVIDGSVVAEFTRDRLLYCQYNPRSDSAYGMSPVEMVIITAHLSLKRQLDRLGYYTEGNVPEHLIFAPENWSTEQIRQAQLFLDDYVSGDVTKRHKLKLIPGGGQLKELRAPDFTVALEEWLARIVGQMFGVAPHILINRARSNRGPAEIIEDQQSDVGLDPFKRFVAEAFTEKIIVKRLRKPNLMFSWITDKERAQELALRRAKTEVAFGATSIDELRVATGREPLGVPNYILMPNGILFLTRQVVELINSGKLHFLDAAGVPHSLDEAPQPSGTATREDRRPFELG